ncbi:MAG: hypothetical protein IJJ33_00815 [Victivallales bacterium]|nr:hypothetical protein [Victivallales bacterium]
MKMKLLLWLELTVLLTVWAGEAMLATPSAGIILKGGAPVLVNRYPNAEWSQAMLRFTLDFATAPEYHKNSVKLPKPQLAFAADSLKMDYNAEEWRWRNRFSVCNRVILAEAEYLNTAKNVQLIEVGAELTPDFQATQFWNSYGKVLPSDQFRERKMNVTTEDGARQRAYCREPFTLTAVGGERQGVFVGFLPFDLVSWHGCSYDPSRRVLRFCQRFAVNPGQAVQFDFVFGSVSTAFGLAESSVQQIYDSFPERWAVVGGQENPYAWGMHSHYQNWWGTPDPEHSRRHHYTIEWTYCPYKRSGDIRMRPELWDYQTFNTFASWPTPKYGGIRSHFPKTTVAEQIELRKNRFRELGGKYGWMFYNSCAGAWCEYQLAEARYADSIVRKNGKPIAKNSWTTGHDREYCMSSYHTSFGEVIYDDMTYLAKELELPGFALDCGSGGTSFRGPSVEKPIPGRAWDEEGVFVDSSVAVNSMVDFIHALNPQKPLSAFTNGTLKGDYIMFERNYVHPEVPVFMPLGRWWIGPRPGCVHGHGHLFKDTVPTWRTLTPETFLPMISRLSDYALLNQFKYGLTNSYVTMCGAPEMYYILPEALELMRAGWQATIPVQTSPELYAPYRARYGKAEHTFLYLANSSPKTSRGTVAIDNRELADDGQQIQLFVLKKRSKAETENHVKYGLTSFVAELPSRTPVLWESVCGITGVPQEMTVLVKAEKTLAERRYSVAFLRIKAFDGQLRVPSLRHFASAEILVNGQVADARRPLRFGQGDVLEIVCRSEDFRLSAEAILGFPFVNQAGEVDFRVGFASGNAGLREVARRFNDYFTYCRKKGLVKGDGLCVLTTDPKTVAHGMVRLELAEGQGNIIQDDNGGLRIAAPNLTEMNRLVTELFYQMDCRFEYYEPFRNVMGLRASDFQAEGKSLPLRCYFD